MPTMCDTSEYSTTQTVKHTISEVNATPEIQLLIESVKNEIERQLEFDVKELVAVKYTKISTTNGIVYKIKASIGHGYHIHVLVCKSVCGSEINVKLELPDNDFDADNIELPANI